MLDSFSAVPASLADPVASAAPLSLDGADASVLASTITPGSPQPVAFADLLATISPTGSDPEPPASSPVDCATPVKNSGVNRNPADQPLLHRIPTQNPPVRALTPRVVPADAGIAPIAPAPDSSAESPSVDSPERESEPPDPINADAEIPFQTTLPSLAHSFEARPLVKPQPSAPLCSEASSETTKQNNPSKTPAAATTAPAPLSPVTTPLSPATTPPAPSLATARAPGELPQSPAPASPFPQIPPDNTSAYLEQRRQPLADKTPAPPAPVINDNPAPLRSAPTPLATLPPGRPTPAGSTALAQAPVVATPFAQSSPTSTDSTGQDVSAIQIQPEGTSPYREQRRQPLSDKTPAPPAPVTNDNPALLRSTPTPAVTITQGRPTPAEPTALAQPPVVATPFAQSTPTSTDSTGQDVSAIQLPIRPPMESARPESGVSFKLPAQAPLNPAAPANPSGESEPFPAGLTSAFYQTAQIAAPSNQAVTGDHVAGAVKNKYANQSDDRTMDALSYNAVGISRAYEPVSMNTSSPIISIQSPVASPQAAETPAPSATMAAAVRLVERVTQAAEHLSSQPADRIDLHIDLDDTRRVDVRISMRDGRVHTDFRSDSAEVRTALASAWEGFVRGRDGAEQRWAAPVFASSSSGHQPAQQSSAPQGSTSDTGLSDSGHGSARHETADRKFAADSSAFQSKSAGFNPAPSAAIPSARPTDTAHRLSVIA